MLILAKDFLDLKNMSRFYNLARVKNLVFLAFISLKIFTKNKLLSRCQRSRGSIAKIGKFYIFHLLKEQKKE